jgi:hypothetical protein
MYWFFHLPVWLFGLIVVSGFVLLSVGGLLLFQRQTAGRLRLVEEMNNDVIFFASAIGVFYSLTVGLIAVGVWTNYTQVSDIVSLEAASIGALYRNFSGYPEPLRAELQGQLRAYTVFLIDTAWPAQYEGRSVDGGTRLLNDLQSQLFAFEPATSGQQVLHAATLRQYDELVLTRRRRLDAVGGALPGVMWAVVLIGAFLALTVTYLLKIQQTVHVVLTGFLAMFIGLVVFVIAGLDNPFSGPLAIGSESFQLILDGLIDLR